MIMAAPLLPIIAAGITALALAPEVATNVQRLKETEQIRNELQTPSARSAFDVGLTSSETGNELLKNPAGFAAGFIPGIGAFDTSRQQKFFYGAVSELKKKGYSDQRANLIANALVRDYAARSSSEIPTALATEVGSELIGGSVLKKILPKEVEANILKKFLNPVAKAGFRSSATAGLYEGASGVAQQQFSGRQFLKADETILPTGFPKGSKRARVAAEVESLAGGALIGAGIAGAFGAVIAGQRIPRKNVSKFAEHLGNFIDPGEYPGDKLANLVRKRYSIPEPAPIRVVGGEPIPTQRLTARGSFAAALTENFNRINSGRAQSNSRAMTQSRSTSQSRSSSQSNTPGKSNVGYSFSQNNIPGQVPGKNSVPGQVPGKTPNQNFLPSQVPNENTTETNTNVPSQSNAFSNIPNTAVTYRGGLPLPPLLGPPQEGSDVVGGGNQRIYINELRRGARLFRRLI